MPKRTRPPMTSRSEHWMRVAANGARGVMNDRLRAEFGWPATVDINWRSPVKDDDYAEYYDESFLERLGVSNLRLPLRSFWPASGPRWDGLARTSSGQLILVEAKAYIEEAVDYGSRASSESAAQIARAFAAAKSAFGASVIAQWEAPLYQYANRLAHFYFLHDINQLDVYLVFLNFADAPDVPEPASAEEWNGAIRLVHKCLGLGAHPYADRVRTIIMPIGDLMGSASGDRSVS